MRRTIFKLFAIWNFDKEEKWLNEMSRNGLALVAVGYCNYTFEDSDPGEYTVRLELLENMPTHPESERYIRFVEATGAEYLGSVFRWVYFRKKCIQGEFNLYSDYPCRIRHLNRILFFIGCLSPVIAINAVRFLFDLYEGLPDYFHLTIGILFSLFFALAVYGFTRVSLMKRKLKREHRIFE
ncbi:MAG: DUF2812 domain-containing protein [Eubacteriales bacterium]|nr:DUF2812 domain-containing protein [Eubacteriales bacterium]